MLSPSNLKQVTSVSLQELSNVLSLRIPGTELAAVAHDPVGTHPCPSLRMNLEGMENVEVGERASEGLTSCYETSEMYCLRAEYKDRLAALRSSRGKKSLVCPQVASLTEFCLAQLQSRQHRAGMTGSGCDLTHGQGEQAGGTDKNVMGTTISGSRAGCGAEESHCPSIVKPQENQSGPREE